MSAGKDWIWTEVTPDQPGTLAQYELLDTRLPPRTRATIWRGGSGGYVWHTWSTKGVGGENATAIGLNEAKNQVAAAIIRQGWAPGGWRIQW